MNILLGFIGMELFSILIHKYLFHGIFWSIHQTHHQKRISWWEKNDFFSLVFGAMAVAAIYYGREASILWLEHVGWGISIYGVLYFIIHDLMAHRRFYPLNSPVHFIHKIVLAHRKHHQSVEQQGQGPWGLFSGF